jgi:tetratricopeptide (TPR) repeat protein
MLERTLGPSNAPVARVSTNLGNTLYRLGEYEQAQLRFEAARTILGASPDPPPELGNVYVGLALIAMDQDRDTDAYGLLQRAQLVWETRLGSDHPGMGIVLGNLGDVALRLGRLDEAMLRLSRAIALKERTLGRQHASLAYPLTTLGKVLIEREDPAAAREHLQRALDLRASNPGVGPRLLAETRFALARAVWAVGDRTRAIELAHLARDGFAGPSTAADQDVAMVERWLAGR